MREQHDMVVDDRCPVCYKDGFAWSQSKPGDPFLEGHCTYCGATCWTVQGPDSDPVIHQMDMAQVD